MEDEILVPKIREIHEESKFTYGPSWIKTALEKMGVINASLSRIRRLMRENGIYSITRYKHKPYPKEKIETRYNDNIINREFYVEAPDKAWCGDITYIKTSTGWVYLAVVIDLFNREVVGYSLSKKAKQSLPKGLWPMHSSTGNRLRILFFIVTVDISTAAKDILII